MKKIRLLLLVWLPVSPLAISQTIISSGSAIVPARVITLGNSVAALDGIWRFQPGDSPWVNGAPEWAQPGFDDSKWAAMDLTPKAGAVNLLLGSTGYLPGWTRKGYPTLSGYAWYRLQVRIVDPSQPLWLKMPYDVDDAYQLYANGRYVGQFGKFSPGHVTLYNALPVSFALPKPGTDGEIELAVRFYLSAATQFADPDVGGMHGPPMLGLAGVVKLLQRSETNAALHRQFGSLQEAFLFLLVLPLAIWAWFHNRGEHTWLWLSLALAWNAVYILVFAIEGTTTVLSLGSASFIGAMFLPFWTMFWWSWFGLRENRWIPRAAWFLAAAETLAGLCTNSPLLGMSFLSLTALHGVSVVALWLGGGMSLLQLVILIEGFRRDRTEALLAAFPVLLGLFNAVSTYFLLAFHIPNSFVLFGLGISLANIVVMLMLVVIVALAIRRFMRTQVRESLARQAIRQDLEQAQQLQQKVLVPEEIASSYFKVETEYRPAQTVGGDFFQTLTKPDGTLLVVIGDVSGKGVSAAMLVAVLVGAIRNQAEYNSDPATMLPMLNRRLLGRSGGHFATCIAAEIKPDGTMRIANAGHLPPYLNGRELELEGSLPLGVIAEAGYPAQNFILRPGDRLTFMTDGVVEATSLSKELFGFDRARTISREHPAAIAQQAQAFGQEDDITVLGIEFAGAPAVALP